MSYAGDRIDIPILISVRADVRDARDKLKALEDQLKTLRSEVTGTLGSLRSIGVELGTVLTQPRQQFTELRVVTGETRRELQRLTTSTTRFTTEAQNLLGVLGLSTKRFTDLTRMLDLESEVLNRTVDRVAVQRVMFQLLGRDVSSVVPALQGISRAYDLYSTRVSINRRLIDGIRYAHLMTRDEVVALANALGKPVEAILEENIAFRKNQLSLDLQRKYIENLRALYPPFIRTIRSMTIDMFWSGLSIMFAVMSLARLQRSMDRANDMALTLARATLAIRDAQREYTEAVSLYGSRSEEARRASIEYRLAQERLRVVQENIREQQQNLIYNYLMLIFGVVPSFLRVFTGVVDIYYTLLALKMTDNALTKQQIIAYRGLAPQQEFQLLVSQLLGEAKARESAMNILTTSTLQMEKQTRLDAYFATTLESKGIVANTAVKQANIATTGLLAGTNMMLAMSLLTVAGLVIGFAYAMYEMNRMQEEFRRQIEETNKSILQQEDILVGHSLSSAYLEASRSLGVFRSSLRDLASDSIVAVRSLDRLSRTTIPEIDLGRLETEINRRVLIEGELRGGRIVTYNAPFNVNISVGSVRSEEDIARIREEVERARSIYLSMLGGEYI